MPPRKLMVLQDSVMYPHLYAGSERSLVTLLGALQGRGHLVWCVSQTPSERLRQAAMRLYQIAPNLGARLVHLTSKEFSHEGIRHLNLAMLTERETERLVTRFAPEVVLMNDNASAEGTTAVFSVLDRLGIPCIYFRRSSADKSHLCQKWSGVSIVANSLWQKSHNEKFGVRVASVVYPTIDRNYYSDGTATPKPKPVDVTFVNPVPNKGVEVFAKLVRLLPELRFRVVLGTWRKTFGSQRYLDELGISDAANLNILPPQMDMRPIYSQTRLLIVPSLYEEPFGRVVVEAQCQGVPVVASDAGGLSEAVGEGGILVANRNDAESFAKAIATALLPTNYARLRIAAVQNSQRSQFSADHQVAQLEDLFTTLCLKSE